MKKLSTILASLLLGVCSIFASGCYLTQAQTMKNIQGTYRLKTYTTTEEHYDAEDKIQRTVTNEIETNGYEIYFVITGNNRGYYAYQSNAESPYIREVELQYEQGSEENKGKYAYVLYKLNSTDREFDRMGVTKNFLQENRPVICGKLFGEEVSQTGFDRSWEKVDKATDLSYVTKQWGEVPTYTYEGYAKEGGYNAYCKHDATTLPEGEKFQEPYLYYYFILDTWKMEATTYYAYSTDRQAQQKTEDITLLDGWNRIKMGNDVWAVDVNGFGYENQMEGTDANIPYHLSASRFVVQNAAEEIQRQIDNYLQQE